MTDFTPALARLHLAADQSAHLQSGLRRRQDELLSLEDSIAGVASGRMGALVLIDQSDDVRRAVRSHLELEVSDARDALTHTRGAVIDALVEHTVPPDVGRLLIHVVDRATREGERGATALEETSNALGSISQASARQSDLLDIARWGVDVAAGQLESSRRAIFRVAEDLPVLVGSIGEVAVAASLSEGPLPVAEREPSAREMSGADQERRHLPGLSAGVDLGSVRR